MAYSEIDNKVLEHFERDSEQRKAEYQIKFLSDESARLLKVNQNEKDRLDSEWKAKMARNRWQDKAKQKMLRKIEQNNKALVNLNWMKTWCSNAKEALEVNDIDGLVGALINIFRYRNKYSIPLWTIIPSVKWGSEGGPISTRPPSPLNVVLKEICKEIGSYDTPDVKAWWERLTSPSDAMEGVGCKYECYFDMELYRYYPKDNQRATGREIEQELYRIREEQSK